jgi:hypothetical protein
MKCTVVARLCSAGLEWLWPWAVAVIFSETAVSEINKGSSIPQRTHLTDSSPSSVRLTHTDNPHNSNHSLQVPPSNTPSMSYGGAVCSWLPSNLAERLLIVIPLDVASMLTDRQPITVRWSVRWSVRRSAGRSPSLSKSWRFRSPGPCGAPRCRPPVR